MQAEDIQAGHTYQNDTTPPIIGVVEKVEGGQVFLHGENKMKLEVSVADFIAKWKPFAFKAHRYFITYVSRGLAGRCGVARDNVIGSMADIKEIEKFIAGGNPDDANEIVVTGWTPFEVPPAFIERALASMSLLNYMLDNRHKPHAEWMTNEFVAAVESIIRDGE